MKEIVIATRNPKKLREIKRLFKAPALKILSLNNFPKAPNVIEDKTSFRGNAVKKAVVNSRFTGRRLTLADDSGLEVTALNGAPGIRSSRYAGPKKIDRENNLKLLKVLKDKSAGRRAAQFACVVALARSGKLLRVVQGTCKGRIGFAMKGETGFGYDPLFIPRGYKRSFAQLGSGVKDRLSHRAKALRKARRFIQGYL